MRIFADAGFKASGSDDALDQGAPDAFVAFAAYAPATAGALAPFAFSQHTAASVSGVQPAIPAAQAVALAPLFAIDPDFVRGGTGPNGKESFTAKEAGKQLTRDGATLNGANVTNTAANVTYAFRKTSGTMPEDTAGFSKFNAAQIAAAELGLRAWADVANVTFTRVGSGDSGSAAYSNSATMLFGNYATGADAAAAFAFYPDDLTNGSGDSDVWVNSSLAYNADPVLNEYGVHALTHEIGHALGLAHPGDYNAGEGDPTYADADYYEDSGQYSIMSYWDETETGANFKGSYASAPLMDDIAAIQRLYGANTTTRTGDTVYGFNSNAGQPWFVANGVEGVVIFCVWDAGGKDTFDFSGYTQGALIDLREGHFSSVGGLTGNVSIAMGVTIEKAFGGSGKDRLIGNSAANTLDGKGGADSMAGGLGNDTYYVNSTGDKVTEESSQGTDVVFSSVTFALTGESIEVLNLTGTGNINGLGNTAKNTLNGNSGNNKLDGWGGADIMAGGLGNDSFYVDNSADVVIERVGEGTDTVFASASWAMGLTDCYVQVLNLTGTANINGTGNNSANTLNGNSGANILNGLKGADIMTGGLGNDTYYVDDAGDKVTEESSQGTDVVFSSVTFALTGESIEVLNLTGSANINALGNTAKNTLVGNSGNNRLDGHQGNDILTGGGGADTFVFNLSSGADRITDFSAAQNDLIDVHAYNAAGTAVITQVGADARIDLGGGNIITVANTIATDSAFLSHIVW